MFKLRHLRDAILKKPSLTTAMKKSLSALILGTMTASSALAGSFYDFADNQKGPVAPPPPPPVAACSSEYFDYNFLDLEYSYQDFDDPYFEESNGISIGLSQTLTECTFVTAGARWDQVDSAAADIDLWSFSLGAGLVFPLAERIHLVAEAGGFYAYEDGGDPGDDDDTWGGYVGPTLRVGVTRNLELFGGATYYFGENELDQFGYTVGTIVRITQGLGIKASWGYTEDENIGSVGIRIAW